VEHLPDEQAISSDQREILEHDAAVQYMLKSINRDRAKVGAPPVVLDETASKAGQMHSDEMAVNGYLSHWTMDGRKPD
ncbi:CAP domain-containing protein, partial [Acinetobacter baumannii]